MIEPVPGLRLVTPLAGSDGTTDVWRGEWQGERVAVKRLLVSDNVRPDLHERFRHEGELLSTVGGRHHVVRLVRAIAAPPMLLLELADGGDLERWLEREGPMSPRNGLAVLRQAADAVTWLHANHVLHRDLKPSNLVLMADGTWRLIDLGVAASGSPPRGLPAGWVEEEIGTPDWRAPELGEDPSRATVATDVFGFGGIALALLTGAPPSQWSRGRFEVAAGVEGVLDRALAARPESRHPTVTALMHELTGVLGA